MVKGYQYLIHNPNLIAIATILNSKLEDAAKGIMAAELCMYDSTEASFLLVTLLAGLAGWVFVLCFVINQDYFTFVYYLKICFMSKLFLQLLVWKPQRYRQVSYLIPIEVLVPT